MSWTLTTPRQMTPWRDVFFNAIDDDGLVRSPLQHTSATPHSFAAKFAMKCIGVIRIGKFHRIELRGHPAAWLRARRGKRGKR